jgi:carbon-monoxide dehydrogenase medium subunit
VKPAPFEYHCPRTLDEALGLLAEHGSDAKPLAGGQSLIPAMNFRLATPAVLVDLNAVRELAFIEGDRSVRIGAMTRHRELERSATIATHVPLITEAMPFVAHAAIRTRGTLGGSLAHADPAAELPAIMVALDAQLTLTSRNGSRSIPAADFFVSLFTTALAPGELLTAVTVPPLNAGAGYAFQEMSRRHGDFALAGVAAVVTLDESQRCTSARITLFSVGERPILATHARTLVGELPTAGVIRATADAIATHDIDPPSDIHASSRYRRQLANVLTRRVLERACAIPERR